MAIAQKVFGFFFKQLILVPRVEQYIVLSSQIIISSSAEVVSSLLDKISIFIAESASKCNSTIG